jgi:uncharacterized protein YggE
MIHTFRRWHLLVVLVVCSTYLSSPVPARAEAGEGITVSGNGIAKAKPTMIEVEAHVAGEAELASDARVKYQDAKKKGLAALDALKNPDLSVEAEGPSISQATDPQMQMRMMQGMAAAGTEKSKVRIAETLKVQIKGVDKLDPDQLLQTVLKVMDTCHDAGLELGPPAATNYIQMQIRAQSGTPDALVNFKIPDKTDLENQAYEKAVADARAKAERIAELNGVKLGRVLSVEDQGTNTGRGNNATQFFTEMVTGSAVSGAEPQETGVSSTSPGEIPLSVHVTLKFEILPKPN